MKRAIFLLGLMLVGQIFLFESVRAQGVEQVSEYVVAEKAKRLRQTRSSDNRLPAEEIAKLPDATELANAASYAFATTTTGSFTDMSTGTTQLLAGNLDDTASALSNIGFDFFFQGVRYTTFSANSNGLIRLGGVVQGSTPYKPLAQAALPLISAYGADQRTHTSGKVHFLVSGTAPNRVLTVEWLNMQSNFNTGGTADLTYQVKLYETTGAIEFVYGSMTMSTPGAADTNSRDPHIGFSSNNTLGNVGTVTAPQSGTPSPTFNGSTATAFANLYTAGSIPVLSGTTDGSRRTFSFASPAPISPSNNGVTGVTPIALTLNWADTSSNETQFAIYRSTDNVNFTFITSVGENVTTFSDSSLTAGTNYFYRVYAVSEGAVSSPATFNPSTPPAGNDTCAGAGGLWSDPFMWADNTVPTDSDIVTIGAGCTVTINTGGFAYGVVVANGGTLQFETTLSRILTVGNDVVINSGGTFRTQNSGTVTGHNLSLRGNFTNNGTVDFSTNANTAGAGIIMAGPNDTTFSLGATSTTNLRQTLGLSINKTSSSQTVTFLPGGTLTVQGANTAGFVGISTGTLKLDGTGAFSNPLFNVAAYSIPAGSGFWLNNPNASVVGQNGSPTVAGSLRISNGTLNIGTATGNSMSFSTGSNIRVEGGAINATGRFGVAAATNAITYTQSGGTVTVCTIGNTSTTLGSFDLGTSLTSSININGGNVVVQLASTAASGPRDFRNQAGAGVAGVTGGTLRMGNAFSGAAKTFTIGGVIPNLVLDNTSAGHTTNLNSTLVNYNNLARDITINTGTTLNTGNLVFLFNGASLINEGTLTANGASSNFVFFASGTPVSVSGSGNFTAPITNFAVQADAGVTLLNTNQIVVNAVRLFSGSLTNANKLTIGNGGTTSATVQIGNTTTPTAAGVFDTTPTFNAGSGGVLFTYLRTATSRTTGPEIPATRTVNNLTYDDNDVTHSLTVNGGDLTVIGTLTLTNGPIMTSGSNTLIHNGPTVTRTNGYVDGNLGRTFAVPAIYTFHVGQNGYSPVLASVLAASPRPNGELAPASPSLTVKPFDSVMSGLSPLLAISRHWSVESNGSVTADLTFTYLAADVNGNEADYRVYKKNGPTLTNMCPGGPCVNPVGHTVTVTGVSSFSLWSASEPFVPTAAAASLSGRVLTANGAGIRNVIVTLEGGRLTQPRSTRTGPFGSYRFTDLPSGENYIVTVNARKYAFNPASRIVGLVDDVADIDFVAQP